MLSDQLIEAWLFCERRKSIDRISSRSYRASRDVPYKQSYRSSVWGIFYETKYRWIYRKEVKYSLFVDKNFLLRDEAKLNFISTQYYTAYGIKYHCCKGYVFKNDVCVPVCTPPCLNGQCMPNNYCKCDHGYVRHTGNECSPYCSNCVNGKCIAPDVCQCNFGYQMKNDVCEPVCAEDCEKQHAYCSSPNTCTCNVGYQAVNRVRIVSCEI